MTEADEPAYDGYLAAVRAELADLADDERTDLLDDVEQHLIEVSAEADGPLQSVLGPPEQYAAELRSAAGLPARGADDQDTVFRRLDARLSRAWPGRTVRRAASWANASPTARGIRDFMPELRPGWWVLRGYLVTVVFGALTSGSNDGFSVVPRVGDNHLLGLLVLAAAVVVSVKLGRRPPQRVAARRAMALAGVLVAVVAAATIGAARAPYYVGTSYANGGWPDRLLGPNGEISNIYAYSPDGKPLDVLLYDQDGRPITTGAYNDYDRNYGPYGKDDRPTTTAPQVANLFPRSEPIIDPYTGNVIGEKSRPVVIPPSLSPSPSPTPTASATPTPTPSATPTPKPTTKK